MPTSKCAAILALVLCGIGGTSIAAAEQVTITRMTGSVKILVAGSQIEAQVGTTLNTPLRVETGSDGSVHIEQPSSGLDIGPDSVVVLPGAPQSPSGVEKILQQMGRVLYSVKPRKTRSFAVETPYLVSVVKGTTFSVAIDHESATVALLEGSIELSGPGIEEPVLLKPNQKAHRAAAERAIAVTTIDTSTPPQSRLLKAPLPLAHEDAERELPQASSATSDLNDITAMYADRRVHPPQTQAPTPPIPPMGSTPNPVPPGPSTQPPPPEPSPTGPAAQPPSPDPVPSAPPVQPPPPSAPGPDPVPPPLPDPGNHESDDDHGDHNNGHGNDADGRDEGSPGKGHGGKRR